MVLVALVPFIRTICSVIVVPSLLLDEVRATTCWWNRRSFLPVYDGGEAENNPANNGVAVVAA
jgi:hypothetical protein